MEQLESDMTMLESLGSIIIVISGVTSCLIVLVMTFYTVKERTREIGIFRALGFSRGAITAQIVLEGAMIGLLGGMIAIAITWASGPTLFAMMMPNSDVVAVSMPDIQIVLLTVVLTPLLGVMGSLFPAYFSSGKVVMEAIRNE